MMDLVRQLEGLARQLDAEGRPHEPGRKYSPLRRADGQVLRTAASVICKQAAELRSLKETIASNRRK